VCGRPSASEAGEGRGRWVRYLSVFGLGDRATHPHTGAQRFKRIRVLQIMVRIPSGSPITNEESPPKSPGSFVMSAPPSTHLSPGSGLRRLDP
jgi:hypothetical protein